MFEETLPSDYLHGLCNLNYFDRIRVCNLESFQLRRVRSDLGFVLKLIHSLVTFVKCYLYEYILVLRLKHFVTRRVNNWNLLNDNIVSLSFFTVFKKSLLPFDKFILRGHTLYF